MSTRAVSNVVAPATDLLKARPSASAIANPISIVIPPMPAVPAASQAFTEVPVPVTLDVDVEAFRVNLQKTSELHIVDGLINNANKGLFFRSSATSKAVADGTVEFLTGMAQISTQINDTYRQADVINARYLTTDYRVGVKKYIAKVRGVVSKYESSANAFVQAQGIIYDADVTATKLQRLGLEKAIGLESDYVTSIHKAESQAFIVQDRTTNSIASSEASKRLQLRIDLAQQIGIHTYTMYEHANANEARIYDASRMADAEYAHVVDSTEAHIKAAESASNIRILGAKTTSDARISSQKSTAEARIGQLENRFGVEELTTKAEHLAIRDSVNATFTANYAMTSAVNEAQIGKILALSSDDSLNKAQILQANKLALIDKNQAHVNALVATGVVRNSLTTERIQNVKDGYALVNGARKDSSEIEYQARVAALAITAKGVTDATVVQVDYLGRALDKRSSFISSAITESLAAEQIALNTETAAQVASIQVTSGAEVTAATDRAISSTAALSRRHTAAETAANAMAKAAIDLTNAKVDMVSEVMRNKYSAEEIVIGSNNATKQSVDKILNTAKIQSAKGMAAADLQGLMNLNDARIQSVTEYSSAEIQVRDAELKAQSAARGVIYAAQAYATDKQLGAQAYSAAKKISSHQQVAYMNAKVTANNQVTTVTAELWSAYNAAASKFYAAQGSQVRTQHVYQYEAK